jgi:AcrR family transcriptional regulator
MDSKLGERRSRPLRPDVESSQPIFDTGSEPERARSTYGGFVARPRKQLDFRAVAAALTDPSLERADMDAIAGRLGVAKPTLYRMAGSREELIAISIDAEAERLLAAVHRDGAEGFFRFVEDAPAGFLLLFGGRYPESGQAVRRVENMLARTLRQGGAHRGLAAAAFVAAAAAVVRLAIESGRPLKAERLRSDFDAAANVVGRIFDPQSVQAAPSPA